MCGGHCGHQQQRWRVAIGSPPTTNQVASAARAGKSTGLGVGDGERVRMRRRAGAYTTARHQIWKLWVHSGYYLPTRYRETIVVHSVFLRISLAGSACSGSYCNPLDMSRSLAERGGETTHLRTVLFACASPRPPPPRRYPHPCVPAQCAAPYQSLNESAAAPIRSKPHRRPSLCEYGSAARVSTAGTALPHAVTAAWRWRSGTLRHRCLPHLPQTKTVAAQTPPRPDAGPATSSA